MTDKDIYTYNALAVWDGIDIEIRTRIIDTIDSLKYRGLSAREIISIANNVLEDEVYWMNYFNEKRRTNNE